ncbi:CYSJ [Enterospora canceri]|uniref:NADPH--hemoprotein reductase n=1 Tax=Enterospora canceri TaxID=1081671 RepID=A0A1Y1S8N5_9MICR|nr:CYSJ [Enterospora canceri]
MTDSDVKRTMIPVLYASQTGNSEYLARNMLTKYSNVFVSELDQFDLLQLNKYPFIVFIVSTHGEGDPPFNGTSFYDHLSGLAEITKKKPFDFTFCCLALGDSSYRHFCKFGMDLSKLLVSLGCKMNCDSVHCADQMDEHGFYDGFNNFIEKHRNQFVERVEITLPKYKDEKPDKNNFQATVISNNLLYEYTETGKNYVAYELLLEIPEYTTFKPGDCIGILPKNTISKETLFKYVLSKDVDHFYDHFDLYSMPHWKLFNSLISDGDKIYQDKIAEIAADYDLYLDYVIENRKNLFDILDDLRITQITNTPEITQHINQISPRYFSVSKLSSGYFSILYNFPVDKLGLATQYMKELKSTNLLQITTTKSRLFFDNQKLLFFCTGTGFTLPRSAAEFFPNKEILVYYGHRHHNQDCLFKLSSISSNHHRITCVASRDDNLYVQDKFYNDITQSPEMISNIDEWLIFVSGNTRLNKEVRKVLLKLFKKSVPIQSETW